MNTFIQRLRRLFTVRHIIWFLFSLFTLIAVLFAVGNWTGARRWAETEAKLEGKGETFDFTALLPAKIEDARNFCAIEPLRDIALQEDKAASKRQALGSLAKIKVKSQLATRGGPAIARKMDVQAWIKSAHEDRLINAAPGSGDSPGEVLQALDRQYPLAKELAAAAATRPDAEFLPSWRDRTLSKPLFSMPFPHYSVAQQASHTLRIRAMLALEAGDFSASAQSTQAILRFSSAVLKDPLLLGFLVSMSIHDLGTEALWHLLEKRGVSEADLAALQKSLQGFDFPKAELAAMRGELAAGVEAIDFIQNNPKSADSLLGGNLDGSKPPLYGMLRLLIPSGFFEHNKATLAELYDTHFIQPLKSGSISEFRAQVARLPAEMRAHSGLFHPSYVFANLAMPALPSLIDRSYTAEAIHRQAILACALERYFIQHHAYPATLSELVPALISSLPVDPVDNQPMRYRQTAAGRYALWSIGFDQKDDGGFVRLRPNAKSAIGDLYRDSYKGDWAWQYEEVAESSGQ